MSTLKINFELKDLDKIEPFGEEPHMALHWFGLTDGLLWIDIGKQTVYEYSEYAINYFQFDRKYNDYQLARFLEDFSATFRFIGESLPKELYDRINQFDHDIETWGNRHADDNEEELDLFYENLIQVDRWRSDRSLDSSHLTDGPYIGCFRCGNVIKIVWQSDYSFDNGQSMWTSPNGSFEMPYDEFVCSVKEFFNDFFAAMDKQVEKAVEKDWGTIFLNKTQLIKENTERKSKFLKQLAYLDNTDSQTDWDSVMALYLKIRQDL